MPEELYLNKYCLAIPCKVMLLVMNVWYFFVKKNCLPTCIRNLISTLSPVSPPGVDSFEKTRLTIEVLIVQYFAGCVVMPGAHSQFQFWFLCFHPLMLSMLGLPPLMTAWIPIALQYPINQYADVRLQNAQHIQLLIVVAYLMIFGPYD